MVITNNLEKLRETIGSNIDEEVIDNQQMFDLLPLDVNEFDMYIFHDTEKEIKVPSNIYKITSEKENDTYTRYQYKRIDKILNGKYVANVTLNSIKQELTTYKEHLASNKLAIVQVGNLEASNLYIRKKIALCSELSIEAIHLKFDENITQEQLINEINKLNKDVTVNAILVQSPLPDHIDFLTISSSINPYKDIDCFNPYNVGLMTIKKDDNYILPCTPWGCIQLLNFYNISLSQKNIVVIGRSNIVGKPLAQLCTQLDATVTICHSKTPNLKEITKSADIIFSAIGKPKLINSSYLKSDCICVDVGISYDDNNKLCGDFDFDDVYKKVKYISPVPNGVGPMTLATLFENYLKLLKIKLNLR